MKHSLSLAALVLIACGAASPPLAPPPPRPVTITVIGTNDLHGHLRALPVLAGYLRILRGLRQEDGGLVLLDGGDMFQGTLESNLAEGAPVIAAYGALGYDAATIGNHEFDYGPVGEASTPRSESDDPRGALLARAREARFPLLSANLLTAEGAPIDWERVAPSVLFERGGIGVGVIGVTTEHTLTTTNTANVRDLRMAPLAAAIEREAAALRSRGADIVLVAAHAGGVCERFDDPHDLSSCDPSEEIFEVARALPAGAVDAIVGGHTHAGVAHVVNEIPIIESYSYGRAFGRVDLMVDPQRGVIGSHVHPPRALCAEGSFNDGSCLPGSYEGREVALDEGIAELIAPALEHARAAQERPLGVTLEASVTASYGEESPLGNLFTDLMRAAHPAADVAITNGGGLRADLPAGPLTYGELYQASPFDNRFALVRMSVRELAAVLRENLEGSGGFFSVSGVRVEAACQGGALEVRVLDERGRPLPSGRELTVAMTDYLATSGEGALGALPRDRVTTEDQDVRDAMAAELVRHGGTLSPLAVYDPANPRVRYPGSRPLTCASP